MKLPVFLAICYLSAFSLIAQDAPANYEKELEEVVVNMAKAYEQLPISKNKDRVLEYFSKDYAVNRVRISIDERVENKTDTYFDLEKLITLLAETPNMEIRYSIDKIIKTYASENVGFCIFDASYDFKRDGLPYVTGNETITYFFQRVDKKWRVTKGHFVQVRDAVYRSSCPCNVYKSEANEGSYMVQIEVPEGTTFKKMIHNFSLGTEINGMRLIDVDGTKYSWELGGNVIVLAQGFQKAGGASGKQLGKASKPIDLIKLILKEQMYPKNCSSISLQK